MLMIVVAASACVARAESPGCAGLKGIVLPASLIGLPTTGAAVSSARERHEGGVAYCRVMGKIYPVDPQADDIHFELNLPEVWNGKALQYGGGTFDGYIGKSDGLGRTAVGLKKEATPLMRGYATLGSDGGHHRSYFPLPDAINALNATFARNAEMQRNFAGEAVKKLHDVAVVLMKARYGAAPRRMYFIGGSTGGREALWMVQRYPADYDGVMAAYAAWDQAELDLQFVRTAQALYAPGGFLGYSKTRMIAHKVEERCDAKDGLRDGIISDPAGCDVPAESLRCADGKPHHGCLSDAQLHTLETFATEERTAVPLSNGVDSVPGYNVLAGASLTPSVGLLHFPLKNPVVVLNSFGYVIGDDVTRNFLMGGQNFNSRTLDINSDGPWHDELVKAAVEIDSTSVALEPFVAHGGKLILVHGTSDVVIPTNSTVDYYERVEARMGIEETKNFARLYLVPGMGHGDGRFDGGFDTVGTLDAWVDGGVAPVNLVVTDNNNGRTRPLCEWPAWPKYDGVGNVKSAASFTCVTVLRGRREALRGGAENNIQTAKK
ncbi:tannase/feruloyl esterase family alpha/beta hydrolase [Granulicella sp. L46]|uniref:tannase/feruloyl esterase family alpha/beta hydrolase n=1 Tax=Granulicella sp. L46 TaxID=1641865 RepID=UPI00131D5201|nr:tannase/feruloyl esterase family alpha/beta hydrolase [Granulicella sp. L46]